MPLSTRDQLNAVPRLFGGFLIGIITAPYAFINELYNPKLGYLYGPERGKEIRRPIFKLSHAIITIFANIYNSAKNAYKNANSTWEQEHFIWRDAQPPLVKRSWRGTDINRNNRLDTSADNTKVTTPIRVARAAAYGIKVFYAFLAGLVFGCLKAPYIATQDLIWSRPYNTFLDIVQAPFSILESIYESIVDTTCDWVEDEIEHEKEREKERADAERRVKAEPKSETKQTALPVSGYIKGFGGLILGFILSPVIALRDVFYAEEEFSESFFQWLAKAPFRILETVLFKAPVRWAIWAATEKASEKEKAPDSTACTTATAQASFEKDTSQQLKTQQQEQQRQSEDRRAVVAVVSNSVIPFSLLNTTTLNETQPNSDPKRSDSASPILACAK